MARFVVGLSRCVATAYLVSAKSQRSNYPQILSLAAQSSLPTSEGAYPHEQRN